MCVSTLVKDFSWNVQSRVSWQLASPCPSHHLLECPLIIIIIIIVIIIIIMIMIRRPTPPARRLLWDERSITFKETSSHSSQYFTGGQPAFVFVIQSDYCYCYHNSALQWRPMCPTVQLELKKTLIAASKTSGVSTQSRNPKPTGKKVENAQKNSFMVKSFAHI